MTRIRIGNMTCGGCERGVRATLASAVPGAAVTVDLAARTVALAGADLSVALAALREDGWEAEPA